MSSIEKVPPNRKTWSGGKHLQKYIGREVNFIIFMITERKKNEKNRERKILINEEKKTEGEE